MKLGLLVLNVLWVCGIAHAQDAAKEKAPPPRELRILALGDLPPFRQEIRGGVRYELEPPPGSIPPREVLVGAGDKAAGDKAAGEKTAGGVRLTLGRVSRSLKVPAGAGPLVLRRKDDAADAKPWVRITRPEMGNFLVLLWRDRKAGSWDTARALVLPDTAPRGSVTFLNVASGPVAVALGTQQFVLPPGKPARRRLPAAKPISLQVGLSDRKGAVKRKLSRSLEQLAGERSLVLVYRSDGEGTRNPIGVKVHREAAPATP